MARHLVKLTLLTSLLLIAGCSGTIATTSSTSEETNPAASEPAETEKPAPVDGFMPIGKKVKIWYLQHEEYDRYQVGLRNSDKKLVWERVTPNAVYLLDDIEQSYIERVEDSTGVLGSAARYNLYLKVNSTIKGGVVPDGKNQDIQTDMIIGGGSW